MILLGFLLSIYFVRSRAIVRLVQTKFLRTIAMFLLISISALIAWLLPNPVCLISIMRVTFLVFKVRHPLVIPRIPFLPLLLW
jgi:hypothetical protein